MAWVGTAEHTELKAGHEDVGLHVVVGIRNLEVGTADEAWVSDLANLGQTGWWGGEDVGFWSVKTADSEGERAFDKEGFGGFGFGWEEVEFVWSAET